MKTEGLAAPPSPRQVSGDRVRTITSNTFAALVLRAQGPVVVEFMTYGCSHCGAIEPAVQQVAEMVKSRGRIFRVNIAVEPDLANRFAIHVTPTFVMFLNGNEVGRVQGPPPTVSSVLTAVTRPFRVTP